LIIFFGKFVIIHSMKAKHFKHLSEIGNVFWQTYNRTALLFEMHAKALLEQTLHCLRFYLLKPLFINLCLQTLG